MADDDKIQVTLDARVLLEAITGIPNEVQALSALINPGFYPIDTKESQKLTPEEGRAWTNAIKREMAMQEGTLVPSEGVFLATPVGLPYNKEGKLQTASNLDFGWLPLEKYTDFQERQYTLEGILETKRAESLVLDTATFVSAITQLRARDPKFLELLVFSDPVIKAEDETTTIKVVFVFTRELPKTALNRPQWLMDLLNQKIHKVRRTIRTLKPSMTSLSHRLTKEDTWQAIKREFVTLEDPNGGDPDVNSTEEKVGEPFPMPKV